MASTTILSPRVADVAPAASLEVSQLDQLCSGNLDAFLEEASRLIKRSPARGTAGSSLAAAPKASLGGSGLLPRRASGGLSKPARPGAVRKVQVASRSLNGSGGRGGSPGRGGGGSGALAAADPARLAKLRAANDLVRACWQYKATGSVKAAAVLAEFRARRLPTGGPNGLAAQAAALIKAQRLDDTTYIYDLGNTTRLFRAWRAALPRVMPFYAVKCNPEPALLKLLAALGAGFDCASRAELEAVLRLGVPTERVIFAHPCKRPADLRFARDAGVQLTTFDTESELAKVAAEYPDAQLVLRVRCDDPEARVPLGLKYGADPGEAPRLLDAATGLGLAVVGVSFHVGSACANLAAYDAAIATAAAIFEAGRARGHAMRLLDIGGGFSGRFDCSGHVVFGDIARTINAALCAHFPADGGVRVIAEPGRYFAETSAALLVPIYGKRDRAGASGGVHKDYWLTDGLYGSFNCIIYDDQKPQPLVLRSPLLPPVAGDAAPGGAATFESTLWGPTCDSADYLYKNVALPELRNGDFLLFVNAGAYTVAGACDFNGIAMTSPNKAYVYSAKAVDEPAESEADDSDGDESGSEADSEEEAQDGGSEDGGGGEQARAQPAAPRAAGGAAE